MKIMFFSNTDWYLYNYRLPLIRALRDRGDEVVLLSPPGRYVQKLLDEQVRWIPFQLDRKGMNPIAELVTISKLIQIFKAEKPSIVHFFTIKPVLYGSISARLSKIPKVVNAITGLGYIFSDANVFVSSLVKILLKISLHNTKVIFQNPDDLAVFVQSKLISESQAALIAGSGVDTNQFVPTKTPDGEPVVILAGRLLHSKGVPEFISVARQLRSEQLKARFVIVGEPYLDNPDSIQPEELAAWKKEGVVEFWGWHDNMADVISKTSIVCLPTRYKEGLPRLLLEAGACARPVIATDIPGCRMVVRHSENGIIIPIGDIPSLKNAIKSLVNDPELCEKMGKCGRIIVENNFSADSIISQTINVYNSHQ